jgi:hypothetical protein
MVSIPIITEKQAQEFSSSTNTRKVNWSSGSHTIWLPPSAAIKLREKFIQKQGIEVEVCFFFNKKVCEGNDAKVRTCTRRECEQV